MSKQETAREELDRYAKMAGLYVRTYSPGDGVTRYRFFKLSGDAFDMETNGYFGPDNGIFTCLGRKAAFTFVQGALAGAARGGYS
jgi:hypothetical protein